MEDPWLSPIFSQLYRAFPETTSSAPRNPDCPLALAPLDVRNGHWPRHMGHMGLGSAIDSARHGFHTVWRCPKSWGYPRPSTWPFCYWNLWTYGFGDPPFSAPICEPLSQLCESNVGASTHGLGDKNPGEMGMSQSATNRGGPSPDRNKANNQVNQWDLLRISMLQSTVYMWHWNT